MLVPQQQSTAHSSALQETTINGVSQRVREQTPACMFRLLWQKQSDQQCCWVAASLLHDAMVHLAPVDALPSGIISLIRPNTRGIAVIEMRNVPHTQTCHVKLSRGSNDTMPSLLAR